MEQNIIENIRQKFEELQFISGVIDKNNVVLDCILLIHSINLTNNLICTGVQEDDPEVSGEQILIPQGWDQSEESIYSLRYGKNNSEEKIYFKFIHENNTLDVNVVSSTNPGKILSMQINLQNFIQNNNKFNQSIVIEYNKQIFEKINVKEQEQKAKQKEEQKQQEEQSENKFKFVFNIPQQQQAQPIFSNFGSSDLNPLQGSAGGMGGNLMGPQQLQGYYQQQQQQSNQGLQIGGSKIRYDPFGPEDIVGPYPGGKQDGFRDLYGNQGGFGIGGGGGMGGGLGGIGGGQGGGGFGKGGFGGGLGGFGGGFGNNKGGFF